MGGSLSCRRPLSVSPQSYPTLQLHVFGLAGSGKHSIVRFLKYGVPVLDAKRDDVEVDMQWITHRKVRMLLWVSEHTAQKEIANATDVARALVCVVDGSDPDKLAAARDYLFTQLQETTGTPNLLILLNKCDKHSFVFLEEAHDALNLDQIRDRHVRIYACSAGTGEGIREALDWLCSKFHLQNGVYVSRKGESNSCQLHIFADTM